MLQEFYDQVAKSPLFPHQQHPMFWNTRWSIKAIGGEASNETAETPGVKVQQIAFKEICPGLKLTVRLHNFTDVDGSFVDDNIDNYFSICEEFCNN